MSINIARTIVNSEWPKVHFYIWPKPKAEYLKIFGLRPNTEAKTKSMFFENFHPSAELIFFVFDKTM